MSKRGHAKAGKPQDVSLAGCVQATFTIPRVELSRVAAVNTTPMHRQPCLWLA